MDSKEFREFGKAMVDFIADYWDTIRDRKVLPSAQPGYLQNLIPKEAPQNPEHWEDILRDIERVIMPGITHWISPNFHAFYPAGQSFPSIVGEMLTAGFGGVALNWKAGPAYTELEVAMMNWLGTLLQLPEEFLNSSEGPGGGIIQGSATESTLVCLLAAKEKSVRLTKKLHPNLSEADIKSKLVAYTSDQANSSVEKTGLLASIHMRFLASEACILPAKTLKTAILEDKKSGLIPCYVVATLGTTGTCAFDNLKDLAQICNQEDVWIHVDAAYAGSAFICPEHRHLLNGIELCDSFNFNPHKWMLVSVDCSALWVKNSHNLTEALNVQRIYLKDESPGDIPDYRNWQIPLGRRFRALKLWFVLRIYGVEGIKKHIRGHINLAKHFEALVLKDQRFEVLSCAMGLVCFRFKGANSLTEELLERINENKKVYLIPYCYEDKFVIRFVICSEFVTIRDVNISWDEIICHANAIVPIALCGKEEGNYKKVLGNVIISDGKRF